MLIVIVVSVVIRLSNVVLRVVYLVMTAHLCGRNVNTSFICIGECGRVRKRERGTDRRARRQTGMHLHRERAGGNVLLTATLSLCAYVLASVSLCLFSPLSFFSLLSSSAFSIGSRHSLRSHRKRNVLSVARLSNIDNTNSRQLRGAFCMHVAAADGSTVGMHRRSFNDKRR